MFLSQHSRSPCQHHSTDAPHSSPSTCCSYQDKRTKPGSPIKILAVSEMEGEWGALDRKVVSLGGFKLYRVNQNGITCRKCQFSLPEGLSHNRQTVSVHQAQCKQQANGLMGFVRTWCCAVRVLSCGDHQHHQHHKRNHKCQV